MAESMRKFITKSGSIYSQIIKTDESGKVISEKWKRNFKEGNSIILDNIKNATYVSAEDYDRINNKFKEDKKSKLAELLKLKEYKGPNGIVWFLGGNGAIYSSSYVTEINPPYSPDLSKKLDSNILTPLMSEDSIARMLTDAENNSKKK
jgi:hypothetical protein